MNHNVLHTIKEYNMIEKGDRVFVALSGGADSVALLHLMSTLRRELGCSVAALHLNHQLRGKESQRDEQFVRRLCSRWKIPLTVGRAPVKQIAARKGLSIEECARQVRYRFFFRHAAGQRDKIATGHTRSDMVETVLLNLVRGTGLQGLGGIPPVRGRIVRPLIRCTRREVEQYCSCYGLSYVTDSTNLEDGHTRNRIRHHIIPILEKENPRFEQAAGEMAEQLRADSLLLEQVAKQRLAELELPQGGWNRQGFLALPGPLRSRGLRRILERKGLRWDRARLSAMLEQIIKGTGGMQLSKELALYCARDSFIIAERKSKPHRQPAAGGGELEFILPQPGGELVLPFSPQKSFRLSVQAWPKYKKTLNNEETLLKNVLDYDKIERIAKLRQCKPADRIRPMGRGCTKTMKNLWSEAKISTEERRLQASLWDAGGILWAEQCGAGEDRAPDESTAWVLVIENI